MVTLASTDAQILTQIANISYLQLYEQRKYNNIYNALGHCFFNCTISDMTLTRGVTPPVELQAQNKRIFNIHRRTIWELLIQSDQQLPLWLWHQHHYNNITNKQHSNIMHQTSASASFKIKQRTRFLKLFFNCNNSLNRLDVIRNFSCT